MSLTTNSPMPPCCRCGAKFGESHTKECIDESFKIMKDISDHFDELLRNQHKKAEEVLDFQKLISLKYLKNVIEGIE